MGTEKDGPGYHRHKGKYTGERGRIDGKGHTSNVCVADDIGKVLRLYGG